MKDYGYPNRQKLIHGDEAAKRYYQRLIKDGYPEHEASSRSGYNPINEPGIWPELAIWLLGALAIWAIVEYAHKMGWA